MHLWHIVDKLSKYFVLQLQKVTTSSQKFRDKLEGFQFRWEMQNIFKIYWERLIKLYLCVKENHFNFLFYIDPFLYEYNIPFNDTKKYILQRKFRLVCLCYHIPLTKGKESNLLFNYEHFFCTGQITIGYIMHSLCDTKLYCTSMSDRKVRIKFINSQMMAARSLIIGIILINILIILGTYFKY